MFTAIALLTAGGLLARSMATSTPPTDPHGLREACDVSIVLVQSDGSAASKAIDAASGGLGWTHAALDSCEVDENGRHVGIDCRPGYGVARRPMADIVRGHPTARLRIPFPWGPELYGCVRGRLGLAYDVLGLALGPGGRRSGLVCSQLIWECLPIPLRQRITVPRHRPVAPNDLARGFGVTAPGIYEVA